MSSLVELTDIPPQSVGAPLPFIQADGHQLILLYLIDVRDPAWDGTYVRSVGFDTAGETCAILTFERCLAHKFGPPNDEAIGGHPLYPMGLRPYSAFKIEGSEWLAEFDRMNSVHPKHIAGLFSKYTHYIFTFHDSTLDVLARSVGVDVQQGSIRQLATRQIDRFR